MINRTTLLGRVGSQPEVRHLEGNRTVAKFSLATTESWKDKDGKKSELTTWHNIEIWGGIAGVVEKHVNKGDLLYLEGKIKNSEYTDKDNVKKYRTDIVVSELKMLGGKKDSVNESHGPDDLPY